MQSRRRDATHLICLSRQVPGARFSHQRVACKWRSGQRLVSLSRQRRRLLVDRVSKSQQSRCEIVELRQFLLLLVVASDVATGSYGQMGQRNFFSASEMRPRQPTREPKKNDSNHCVSRRAECCILRNINSISSSRAISVSVVGRSQEIQPNCRIWWYCRWLLFPRRSMQTKIPARIPMLWLTGDNVGKHVLVTFHWDD